jgi:hypothetical protein
MTKHTRELESLLATIALQTDGRLVEIRKTNGRHIRARFDRGPLIFTRSTPSDWRTTRNLRAQAKRALR